MILGKLRALFLKSFIFEIPIAHSAFFVGNQFFVFESDAR